MGAVEAVVIGGFLSFATAAVSSVEAGKKEDEMQDALKKQQQAEVAAQSEQAARERRKQLRESRVKRAQIENVAAASSLGDSSAAIGGAQGITAQAGQNIGNINTAQSRANVATQAAQGVMDVQSQSGSIFSQVAAPVLQNVGGNLLGQGLGGMFSSDTKSPTTKKP